MKKSSIFAITAAFALTFTAFGFTACGNGNIADSSSSSSISSDIPDDSTTSSISSSISDDSNDITSTTDNSTATSDNTKEDDKTTSGVVTSDEWLTVMTAENYNFSLDLDLTIKDYNTSTGELAGSTTNTGTAYCDLAVDEDKDITGTIYENFTSVSSSTVQYEYYFVYKKDCVIQYVKYASSGNAEENTGNSSETYSAASAAITAVEDTEWQTDCYVYERDSSIANTLLLSCIPQLFIANYAGIYSLDTEDYFKYNEELGAYLLTYNDTSDNYSTDYTYTIKIKDGNISSLGAATYVTKDGAESSESDSVCTYYNYGNTAITIPEDIQAEINQAYEEYINKSDVVSADEWAAALTEEKALNVTITATGDGGINANSSTADIERFDMTTVYKASITDHETYTSGATYLYLYYVTLDDNKINTTTSYAQFDENGCSYVSLTTSTDSTDNCNGGTSTKYNTSTFIDSIKDGGFWADSFASDYSNFTYKNGAYTYTAGEVTYSNFTAVTTYYIKIKDGNLVSLTYQIVLTPTDGGETEAVTLEYTFSDYGATTVDIPEEYTYEYYLNNYSN